MQGATSGQLTSLLQKRKAAKDRAIAAKIRALEDRAASERQREDVRVAREAHMFNSGTSECFENPDGPSLSSATTTVGAFELQDSPFHSGVAEDYFQELSPLSSSTPLRPTRARRPPKRLQDYTPSSVSSLRRTTRHPRPRSPPLSDAYESTAPLSLSTSSSQPPPPLHLSTNVTPSNDAPGEPDNKYEDREVDGFGLYRSYLIPPAIDPDDTPLEDEPCDAPTFAVERPSSLAWWTGFGHTALEAATRTGRAALDTTAHSVYYPFRNSTTFRLMHWFYSGSSMKSLAELDRLVDEVILADDFDREHLRNFSATTEAHRLDNVVDKADSAQPEHLKAADGWHSASVKIKVPCDGVEQGSEAKAREISVPGLHYRRLLDIIKVAFQDAASATWTLVPYRLFWKPPGSLTNDLPERVYSEIYNSEAMNAEYKTLVDRPRAAGDNLEVAIAAIMFWSDSTHLASFGNASLWPIYMFFGNQSKYTRAHPTAFAAHHVAYIPTLPDDFQDTYQQLLL
uniref:M protein type 1 n=1 Tax=Ganoderma boninense TaxID=34458 RepID=A0A5K1JWI9_9APHY|nr:M protein type 1 [Ganoderma boninense]